MPEEAHSEKNPESDNQPRRLELPQFKEIHFTKKHVGTQLHRAVRVRPDSRPGGAGITILDDYKKKTPSPAKKKFNTFVKKPLYKTILKTMNSVEKVAEVALPFVKKYKGQIVSLLAFSTVSGAYMHQQQTTQERDNQHAEEAHATQLQEHIKKRQLSVYTKDVERFFTHGDMSYAPRYPEALENPMYQSLIPSTIAQPIGPRTITNNYEGMMQKATFNEKYTGDVLRAVKYITKYRDLFEYAAKRLDMPWELLASIAERENHMHFVLKEDQTWQDFDEVESFKHTFADGSDVLEMPSEDSAEIRREVEGIVQAIPNLSNLDKEQLKAVFPLWMIEAQRSVYRGTNHRKYQKHIGLGYGSQDTAAMLAYAEIHNGLYNRAKGRATEYVWSGTSWSTSGKNMRNDNAKLGQGRFYYNAHAEDPQPGVAPILRLLKGQPHLEGEEKEELMEFLTSQLQKE